NFCNALAATAAAVALDIPPAAIADALAGAGNLPGRLQLRPGPGGWQLVDDSYNANPASLRAALQVLAEMDGEERWLVLGDMAELGAEGERLHAEAGLAARELGISRLYAIGELARAAAEAFGGNARHFDSHAALIAALASELHAGVICLVKGSR